MKYMKEWFIAPENMQAVLKRLAERPEPLEGIKMLGRWNILGTGRGYVLYETENPIALAKLNLYWSDLSEDKIVPVIDEEESAQIRGAG